MNKSKILGNSCTIIDEHLFSTGIIDDPQSKSFGISFEKAKLKACENIIYYIQTFVEWPQKMNEQTRKMIWDEFVKTTTLKIDLQKATVIFKNKEKDVFSLVLCCPQDLLKAKKYDFEAIKKTLLDPNIYQSGLVKIAVSIELSEGNTPDKSILEAFAQKTAKEYGENVGQVIRGENAYSFRFRKKTDLSKHNLAQLLSLLDLSPYDPEICYFLGKKMKDEFYPKTANIFFNRGAVASTYDKLFSEKCKQEITQTLSSNLKLLLFPKMLLSPFSDTISFEDDCLKFLEHSAGLLPVGTDDVPQDDYYLSAKKDFSNNNLERSFWGFCKSASNKLTFSACNMAGNAGRRIEKKSESVAMLLQAVSINPSSPYPWVHLAWIYKGKDLKDQMSYCLEKIKLLKQDQWTSDQLNLLNNDNQ